MSSSAGRRHAAHIAARNYFRANNVPCWECGGKPYAADHHPAISLYNGDYHAWAQAGGTYRSHCRTCSCRQGATMTNAKNRPEPSRQW